MYKLSHLEEVTWPSSQYPGSFWPLQRIQNRYHHSVFRFKFSLKNGSKHKLNHSKQRRSPFPDTYQWFVHIGSCGENFKFPSSDSESPQKLSLEASWMVPIRGGYPTCSWCPITVSHNPNLGLQTWAGQPVKGGFHTRLAKRSTMGTTAWLACPSTMSLLPVWPVSIRWVQYRSGQSAYNGVIHWI